MKKLNASEKALQKAQRKTIWISGAASVIERATAIHFSQTGYNVALFDARLREWHSPSK